MQCVVQRVRSAHVVVDGDIVGEIGHGLVVLVGIATGDTVDQLAWMAQKICRLRIFADEDGRFDRSLLDVGGAVLSVSQFTLFADVRKGTRPSFIRAADPAHALRAWNQFNVLLREHGVDVATGVFGASMQLALVNDGPVTIVLEREA